MKKKIVITCIIAFVCIWVLFFVTDSIRCKNDKEPIFCVEVARYNDGGSIKYVGLFYNYYALKELNPDKTEENDEPEYLFDKAITPWFFSVDYAKRKKL